MVGWCDDSGAARDCPGMPGIIRGGSGDPWDARDTPGMPGDLMPRDIRGCPGIVIHVRGCSGMFEMSGGISRDLWACSVMSGDVRRCLRISGWGGRGCPGMSEDVRVNLGMFGDARDVWRCTRMLGDSPRCSGISGDVRISPGMFGGTRERCGDVEDVGRC